MKPFETMTEAILWWRVNCVHQRVSLLIDNTSIGLDVQRREVQFNTRDGWIMGFPCGY